MDCNRNILCSCDSVDHFSLSQSFSFSHPVKIEDSVHDYLYNETLSTRIRQKFLSDLTKPFFKKPVQIQLPESITWTFRIRDMNSDGLSDIVGVNFPYDDIHPGISIFYNTGDNSFTKENIFVSTNDNITGWLSDIDIADFDNDGDPDILFTSNEHIWYYGAPVKVNGSVYLLRNNGNGTFEDPEQILWLGPGEPYSPDNWINLDVGCGDFDRDGDVDFVVGGNCGWVAFYKNDGTGHNFSLRKKIYDYGNYTWDFAVADFNNDGWLDFVVSSEDGIYLKLNNHNSSCFDYGPGINILQHIPFGFEIGPMGPAAIAPIDYNRDGREDIIYMCLHTIYLLMNNGNLTFTPIPVSYMLGDACLLGSGVEVADLDMDGWEDLIIGDSGKTFFLANNRTFVSIIYPIDKVMYFRGKFIFSLSDKWWGKCIIIENITFRAVGLEPLNRVEFFVNGELVENDTEPPYEWTWNIRNFLPKWYTVDAVAYRSNGEFGGRYRLEILKIL